jgi:hypothetical protein
MTYISMHLGSPNLSQTSYSRKVCRLQEGLATVLFITLLGFVINFTVSLYRYDPTFCHFSYEQTCGENYCKRELIFGDICEMGGKTDCNIIIFIA